MKQIGPTFSVPRSDGRGTRIYAKFQCPQCKSVNTRTVEHLGKVCKSCNTSNNEFGRPKEYSPQFDSPQVKYELINLTSGERIAGIECEHCHTIYESGLRNKRNRYMCGVCQNAAKPKRTTNTSGYIGVSRHSNTPHKPSNMWIGKITRANKPIYYRQYKDTNDNTNWKHIAAIERDLYIREHNLPSKRNFTDEQLEAVQIRYKA